VEECGPCPILRAVPRLTIADAKCYEMSAEQLRRVRVTTAATETLIIVVNIVTTVNNW